VDQVLHSAVPPTFYVRDVPVYGDVILAPWMATRTGLSGPFAAGLGSAMSYTSLSRWKKF